MPDSSQHTVEGLISCFHSFEGTYCARKLIEMLVSAAFLVVGTVLLAVFIYKYRVARPYWLVSILLFCIASLIVNIFFCFFNQSYWLYALQSFLCSMYYLILVSYICYAYVLKHCTIDKQDLMARLNYNLHQQQPKVTQKIVFLVVVVIVIVFYLAIFITSIVYQVKYDNQELQGHPNSSIHYCQETWYLIINVICIVLSVVVVVVMLKSQTEQYSKLVQFNKEQKRRQSNVSSSGSSSDKGETNNPQNQVRNSLEGRQINNPFKCLWVWVGINVIGQILDLVQSGLLLDSAPPQCYISDNRQQSNIITLVFVFLTIYMCYGATYWYIVWVKIMKQKTLIDRTVLFSAQINVEGNIQLFQPSKQETITFQL